MAGLFKYQSKGVPIDTRYIIDTCDTICKRSVHRALKKLQEKGLVEILAKRGVSSKLRLCGVPACNSAEEKRGSIVYQFVPASVSICPSKCINLSQQVYQFVPASVSICPSNTP
jgi:hypothetical protein